MTQQIPQLPSRTGNTDWFLYNWLFRLSKVLKDFLLEVYVFIDDVTTYINTTAPGAFLSNAGDTGAGNYTFNSGTITFNASTQFNGTPTIKYAYFLTSADGTTGSYIYNVDTAGDLFIWDDINSVNAYTYDASTQYTTFPSRVYGSAFFGAIRIVNVITFNTGEYDAGTGGTGTIILSNANVQRRTINANATVTLSGTGVSFYRLKLVTSTYTVTIAASTGTIHWLNSATQPAWNTAAAGNILNIFCDGTDYYISVDHVDAA